MINPLSENPAHLYQLCERLQLGLPIHPIERVFGGFHHLMWRLDTQRGSFAIKQLAADTDVGNALVAQHYNVTETIAEAFTHHGIDAVHALQSENRYLQVCERSGYLVYPWSDARSRDNSQLSEQQALCIARVLATMHRADLQIAAARESENKVLSHEEITRLVSKAEQYCVHKAKLLRQELTSFFHIADAHKKAIHIIDRHQVISHGDLDQKNVLWDGEDQPVLIDWESARRLNPTYEIVLAALDWGGITNSFDQELFAKIICAYREAGGVIEPRAVGASFDCILGDWLTWLLYTIARAVDRADPAQRDAGSDQVDWILPTILHLKAAIPALLAMQTLWQASADRAE